MLTDEQLLQYSRQIMLSQVDVAGQEALLKAHVVIIGLGGLGAPVALYLASAGVGKLTLVDFDQVDLSNLQRQIIHSFDTIGMEKVESAALAVQKIAPACQVEQVNRKLDEKELADLVGRACVVVDCCDNFETRFMLNRICFQARVPLVSGAAIRWEGQISTFPMQADSPCYRCFYEEDSFNDQTCSQNGVAAPLVGVIGSIQALEALKLIVGCGETVTGRVLIFDGLYMDWRSIKLSKRADCPVCATPF